MNGAGDDGADDGEGVGISGSFCFGRFGEASIDQASADLIGLFEEFSVAGGELLAFEIGDGFVEAGARVGGGEFGVEAIEFEDIAEERVSG